MRRIKPLAAVLSVIAALWAAAACTPSVPGEYLSEKEMEDLLYDYHIADAMVWEEGRGDTLALRRIRAAVFKKHGCTEARFDSSMVYYMRHTTLLQGIYESLAKRIGNEALSLGTSASEVNRYSVGASTGDTVNIWTGDKAVVLSQLPPFNSYSFTIEADSTFRKGDRIGLALDVQFIYQEGMRNGYAVLAVKFGNDSVATRVIRMNSNGRYTETAADKNHKGIKDVSGYFMIAPTMKGHGQETSTTMKMMVVSNVNLARIHEKESVEKKLEAPTAKLKSADSTAAQVSDSLENVSKQQKERQ